MGYVRKISYYGGVKKSRVWMVRLRERWIEIGEGKKGGGKRRGGKK